MIPPAMPNAIIPGIPAASQGQLANLFAAQPNLQLV
jgi:hypothetical protein